MHGFACRLPGIPAQHKRLQAYLSCLPAAEASCGTAARADRNACSARHELRDCHCHCRCCCLPQSCCCWDCSRQLCAQATPWGPPRSVGMLQPRLQDCRLSHTPQLAQRSGHVHTSHGTTASSTYLPKSLLLSAMRYPSPHPHSHATPRLSSAANLQASQCWALAC